MNIKHRSKLAIKNNFSFQSHTGVYIMTKLQFILESFGLHENEKVKILSITTDSAANMILAKELTEFRSVECVAHKIHLLVIDAINGSSVKAIFDQMKKIVTFFKQSTTAKAELDALRKADDNKVYSLLQSVPTRWDSDYIMMDRFLELRDDLAKVILKHKDCEPLTSKQLVVSEVVDILFLFHDFTNEMSSEASATSSFVIPLTNIINDKLNNWVCETSEANELRLGLIRGIKKRLVPLDDKYDFAVATFLDPRYKDTAFTNSRAAINARIKLTNLIVDIR